MKLIKYARVCDECAKGMNEGFVIDGGEQHYCSGECLHQTYITKEEWDEMYTEDGDNYWTEWEDVEDDDYVLGDEDGNIVDKAEDTDWTEDVVYKNKVTKSRFLNWYFGNEEEVGDFGKRCVEMLMETGMAYTSVEVIFRECGYIPKHICVDSTDAEGVDYDPTEVELIKE
jgi:hypothetical protein